MTLEETNNNSGNQEAAVIPVMYWVNSWSIDCFTESGSSNLDIPGSEVDLFRHGL